jgi:hypothetical protein
MKSTSTSPRRVPNPPGKRGQGMISIYAVVLKLGEGPADRFNGQAEKIGVLTARHADRPDRV